jgi:hypothetical protein
MDEITPDNIVVPIFGVEKEMSFDAFLGTGTFVGNGDYLVTAHHVVRDWKKRFAILIAEESWVYEADIVLESPETDLAILKVDGYRPEYALPLAKPSDFHFNIPIVCLEHGTTRQQADSFYIDPSTRLGNITRFRNLQDQFNLAGDEMLELSFPALRGASGAAVMSWTPPFTLFGIVIANTSYHLLPAQIESVLDESNQIYEETKFMLPQALAVNVKHLSNLLMKLNPPENP